MRVVLGLTVSLTLYACGEESAEEGKPDCTTAANACAEGFECREVFAGEWLCRPTLDAGPRRPLPMDDDQTPGTDAGMGAPPSSDMGTATDMGSTTDDAGATVEGDVTISGRQILVGGTPLHMKGVNWNPVPRGGVHPQNIDFAGYVVQDGDLMAAAGINVVRTYEAITDTAVLDALYERGIYVITTVYAWGGSPVNHVDAAINATKDHPAVLMWAVGNEWNYNGLYYGMSFDDSRNRVREVIQRVKSLDPSRPVATVYGEMPSPDVIQSLPEVDVWGLNVYRGMTFGDLFTTWSQRAQSPMFLGEFGADAYNAHFNGQNNGAEDQAAQAEATTALAEELVANSTLTGGSTLGGCLFEFADEWWKDGAGSPNEHDVGGAAPGGGPHPDQVFNEEWWGLVEIDRTPREAYRAYSAVASPNAP